MLFFDYHDAAGHYFQPPPPLRRAFGRRHCRRYCFPDYMPIFADITGFRAVYFITISSGCQMPFRHYGIFSFIAASFRQKIIFFTLRRLSPFRISIRESARIRRGFRWPLSFLRLFDITISAPRRHDAAAATLLRCLFSFSFCLIFFCRLADFAYCAFER